MARTGIKDGREQGPQKNKWGYVNNPRWQISPMGPLHYESGGEPQVWDPDQKKFVTGEIKVHIPCGHWHTPQGGGVPILSGQEVVMTFCKLQSMDIYDYIDENLQEQQLALLAIQLGTPTIGQVVIIAYDTGGRVYVEGTGMVQYSAIPEWSLVYYDSTVKAIRSIDIQIISDSLWTSIFTRRNDILSNLEFHVLEHISGDINEYIILPEAGPVTAYDLGKCYFTNKSDGIIALPVQKQDALYYYLIVNVSTDYGVTFQEIEIAQYDINTTTIYYPTIRHDANGNLWIAVLRTEYDPAYVTFMDLWKSTNGITWNLISSTTCGEFQQTPLLTCDNTDLYLYPDAFDNVNQLDVYKSIDGGITFSIDFSINLISLFGNQGLLYAINIKDNYVVAVFSVKPLGTFYIVNSIDSGATFSVAKSLAGYIVGTDYAEVRYSDSTWIFISLQFHLGEYLLYLTSDDNGMTWNDVISPLSTTDSITIKQYSY